MIGTDKLITIGLMVLMLFFLVSIPVAIKTDQNSQNYVSQAVEEFVDDSCASGYISPDKYITMMQRIGNTGNLYTVDITHKSVTITPAVDKTTNQVEEGEYVRSYNLYRYDEILEEMFPQNTIEYNNYPLKNGDYLAVSISLKEPSIAGKLLRGIIQNELKTINFNYGSFVGSTEEAGLNMRG